MTAPFANSRVVLVGMMGSGKSTVGVLTAELLGAGFADSDEEIETIHGTECPGDVRHPWGGMVQERRERRAGRPF